MRARHDTVAVPWPEQAAVPPDGRRRAGGHASGARLPGVSHRRAARTGRLVVVTLWCLAFTGACMSETEPVALDFTLVSSGSGQSQVANDPIESPAYRILRDRDAWQAYRDELPGAVPQADIDFDHEVVLCVYRGQKPTGGYGISVTSMELRDGTVTIGLDLQDPPSGSMLTQALTSPYAIYRIQVPQDAQLPSAADAIRFVRSQPHTDRDAPAEMTLQRLQ